MSAAENQEGIAGANAESATIAEALRQAVAHHQAGRLQEAEQLYRVILQVRPDHPDANHNLGVLLGQAGRHTAGLPHLKTALEADPTQGDYWLSYADALLACGEAEDALTVIQTAMQHGLDTPETRSLRDKAEACRRLASETPDQSIQPQPGATSSSKSPPQAECDRLTALLSAGQHAEMESRARWLIEQYPDSGFAWKMLSIALHFQGKNGLPAFLKVTELLPDDADGHCNLGEVLRVLGRPDDAVASCRRALAIKPDFAEACYNLGNAYRDLGRLDDAAASYRNALAIKPDYAEAHNNLGNVLKDLMQLDDAVANFRRALEIKPDYAEVHSNLLYALNFHPNKSREEILAVCREYDERFGLPHRGKWPAHCNSRDAGRILRVGYVSPDFRRHAVAIFAEPILASHDKSQVEIFCYAEVRREDEYTDRFRRYADHWHSTVDLSDDAVAQMILDHRIDILVDLAGHTTGNRLPVFARKPAPIQLTYLGYPGSTGLSAMDYRITDRYADAVGEADAFYVEHLLRLPDSLWCYRPACDMPETSPLPALSRGCLTFGSFNNVNKIDRATLALWAELLRALPAARLMMLTVPEGETRLHLARRFAELGIEAHRLEFHGKLSAAEFYRKFLEVDITLDPVTVNGATTTCESLWMGAPVISLVGERFLKRAGLSLLSAAGFADFAAASPKDYIRIAAHLAGDLPLLAEIRAGLRDHLATTPLTDEVGFTRNLEKLYREIWGKWCSNGTQGGNGKELHGQAALQQTGAKGVIPSELPKAGKAASAKSAKKGMSSLDSLPQAEYTQLIALFNAGRHAEMESLARAACGRHPDSGFAWKALSASLQIQGKDALNALRKAAELLPDDDDTHSNLGNALKNLGQLDSAVASYRRALEINPGFAEAYCNLGVALQGLGQLDGALANYRRALKLKPDYAEAHSNLGSVLRDLGQLDGAVASYRRALEIKPGFAMAHYNLGNALRELGQLDDAVASYARALALKPDYAEAHYNLGNALKELMQLDGAAASYRRAVEIKPDYAAAHGNLGLVLRGLGLLDEAVVSFAKALTICPDLAEVHNNLGLALKDLGQFDAAAASCRQAIAIQPDLAEAHSNLGSILVELGQFEDAVASYRNALKIKPDLAETHNNLGNTLKNIGLFDEAVASYGRALEIKPDFADAHCNLGLVLKDLKRFDDALASCHRALVIQPNLAEAHSNLGSILLELGQFDDAVASFRCALAIKPNLAETHVYLGSTLNDLGFHDEALASYAKALEIKPDYAAAYNSLLFTLNYHPDKNGEEIFAAYRKYEERFGLPQRGKWRPHGNERNAKRRLKVGYVSPDFRRHSCRHFLEPLLAHHDKGAVEVYAYAELSREDEVTARYRSYVDHWAPTMGMTDDALAERIRADSIDILVDLAGHTTKNRLSVFARKPAPVSLSWLGFGYTTGLSAVDYLLTDAVSAPEGCEGVFSETLWRLDTPNYAYRPAEGMGAVNPLPALTRGYVTFGTLTRAVRINHRIIRVWSEILKRVEGARLVIDSRDFQDASMQAALAEKFAAHGVTRERLEIGCHSPPWDVLRSLDIGLDCFPHNSGTTLFETLYMGVPFVTLAGRPSVGRLGGSVLEGVGMPSLIARTEDGYVEIAAVLASDLTRLSTLRAGLREKMQTGALMDEVGFARKVEAAYREMWIKWIEEEQCGGNGEGLPDRTPHPPSREVSLAELPMAGEAAAAELENKYPAKSVSLESLPQTERNQLIALFNTGRYREVESLARVACERDQGSGFAWKALGVSLQAQGKNALAALQKATELLPDDADAHNSLGVALESLGRFDDAVASCRRALEIAPGLAEAHSNLGNALHGLGRFDEAAASYHRALEIKPDYAEAHCNLAATLKDSGQLDEALAACLRALEIKPDYAEAHFNLGVVLQSLGQPDNALACYRRTLELMPGFAEAHNNLGYSLLVLGNPVGAVASFRRALEIKPDYAEANSNLLYALNFNPDISREAILAICREYDERLGLPHQWPPHGNSRDAGRTLRIGYVSPDFRQHAVAIFAEPILANHDKSQVEIFCYAEVKQEDECTARFRRYADHWHSTVGLSDDAAAQMIREHQIDILVDLAGHTKGNRLQVFARKPAPIQITYLGYPGSTGLSAVDYRITDRYADPEGEADAFYVERLLRLPDSLCCYRPVGNMPETSPLPALSRGYLTFGSFNNYYKIDRRTLALWAELLRALPAARLMLLTVPEGETRLRLARSFAELGVDAERLEFHGKLPVAEFHRKFLEVDITLDPVSVSGGTTTCESLWMGVPVIALAGERFITRVSHSFLNTAGFADFSAASPKDYIRIAAHLADNLPLLAEIRAGLRDHLATTPLTDEVGFTRNLEKLYREIWVKWCRNGQPDGNGEALSAPTTHARARCVIPAELPRAGKIATSKSAKKSSAKSLPQAERDRLISLFNAGRYAEAENQARLVCERYPDSGFAWKAFGASLHVQGKNALTALQKATELLPNDAEAHNNLAVTLNEIGQPAGALASCRRALAIKPHFAAAHFNLGNAERDLGRFNDAAASYRKALKIKPDYAEAHNNLGVTLNEIGQPDGAMASCRRALAIKPDFAEAHYNLGNAQRDLGLLDDAAASYRSAVRIKPDYAEAHNNLGSTLKDLGQFDDAIENFHCSLKSKPDYVEAFHNLLFALNYHPDKSEEAIFAAYREYDERFGLPHRSTWQPHTNSRELPRRLKVGYVSPDFCRHSCRHFLEPLLAHHDKNAVEIYAYAELAREDEVTARYKGYVDHWAPTVGMSDEALSTRIRADGIDILVDLAGHTKGNRLAVFAHKPAPVSLSWLGFGYTTGLSAVDYLLTDGTSAPEGCEGLFSEKPWRLETPGFAYRPAEGMGATTPLPALTRGTITFGTLTRAVRINQHTIRVWSQILKRVEGSQLVIDSHNFQSAAMQDALAEKFAVHGIARERLEIGCHSPPWDVLRSLDIGLDCFPHNSGTTLFETLYMGVPFVTLAGRPSVGRLGGSVLEGVGHPELIARTEEDYVEIAVALASDLPKLATLRAGLRKEMETGPLMDEAGFARKVEAAYREMFGKWVGE